MNTRFMIFSTFFVLILISGCATDEELQAVRANVQALAKQQTLANSPQAQQPWQATVKTVRFFESGKGLPPKDQRQYTTRFEAQYLKMV
jgi:hypothetical protein